MAEKDIKILWFFTLRIAMYTGKEDKYAISSFIHGYEIGRSGECNFSEQLTKFIEKTYRTKSRALGWIDLIERAAEKMDSEWITVFKKESIKLLTSKHNAQSNVELTDSIKRRINSKINGIENHFNRNWITDWFGIVDLRADWFIQLWSEKELRVIIAIENELNSYGKVRFIKTNLKPTANLKNLCKSLLRVSKTTPS